MITERVGNLLDQSDINVILHQCNLFHTFGAGIAKEIRERLPEAYEADKKTPYNDIQKLGTYSYGFSHNLMIINMYSQTGIHSQHRMTSYDHMVEAFNKIKFDLDRNVFNLVKPIKLGLPCKIGCGLANGDWRIVKSIIESVFSDATFDVVIVEYVP